MDFRVETNLACCHRFWERFSPSASLFDFWEYRLPFYKGYGYQPYFIIGRQSGRDCGLLPLWYEKKRKFYTFFGGTFPEPNTFFIPKKSQINLFLDQCPKPTKLYYINQSEANFYPFAKSDPHFFLEMKEYHDDLAYYFSSFGKKHRKNLLYDLRQLEKLGYSFQKNHLDDFEIMVELNKKRFKKDSDFEEKEMIVSMKTLMQTAHRQRKLNLISVKIGRRPEAVGMAVINQGCYWVLSSGRNPEIENIGKLLIVGHIKSALALGISKIEFLSTESGWKKLWHLQEEALFEFVN